MNFYRILILTFLAYTLISCGGAEERKSVYMEKAKASIEAGNLDKARIELKNVLQIDPKNSEAYFQLGTVLEEKKEYRKAFGMYLKADELNPELLENQARLGRIYLIVANDPEKAQEKVDLILSKEPQNSYGLLLKAAIALRSKDVDEAINIAKNIPPQDPAYLESVSFLSTVFITNKKTQDAIDLLDTALENNKSNEKLSRLLAVALVENKEYGRAEALYLDFLERNPDSSSSYNNLAVFYTQKGNKTKAVETLRESVDNDSNNENRILTLIKYIKTTKGNVEAIKELKSFVSLNTGLGKLRTALAELFLIDGSKQSAVKVLNEAISDFSDDSTGINARTTLASIYISDKDYDKAAEVVDDALSISPNDPKVNYLGAKLAVRDKDMERAIISLRIVTKEMPENIGASILLAGIYQQEGNEAQARSTLNSAYENNKTNVDGLLKLAQYHYKRDINQAEKIIDRYNNIKNASYDGLSLKAAILNKNKKQSEAYEISKILIEKYSDRSNGYLQAVAYHAQKKDIKSAISLLEQGYLNAEDNRKILEVLTGLQVQEKEFDVAAHRLKAEITLSPDDVVLKLLLAKVFMANNDTDSAISLLNEILAISPNAEAPYLLLSQIYKNKRELSSVKKVLVKGITNVKSSIKIPLELATAYEAESEFQKAIDVYAKLNKLKPDNLIFINNLASLLSDHGSKAEDLQFAKTLIQKLEKSDQPVFLDTVGWVYHKLGDSKNAIQYLTQATEKMPKINVFNYHLGMSYLLSGDKIQAKILLEKSIANKNDFKERSAAEHALSNL